MAVQIENLRELSVVDDRYSWDDFEVTATNFNKDNVYYCENDHESPKPALFVSSSSYDPKTGNFDMRGSVVYCCAKCQKPVFLDEDK